jgi:hypothetical protein
MLNTHIESARLNLNTLSVALANHIKLLKSGLTPYEAQCATLTAAVVQALDASSQRVQENFGLYLHYQVEQSNKESLVPRIVVANKGISDRFQRKEKFTAATNTGTSRSGYSPHA